MVLLGKACSLNLAILEMACFPSSGAALAQLAAIVNPANKPTQIEMHLQAQIGRWAKNWLSYSVFEKKCLSAITVFFAKKKGSPNFSCHKSEPSKQYMSFRIIWKKFATIATLGTNQDSTLYICLYRCQHSESLEVEPRHIWPARIWMMTWWTQTMMGRTNVPGPEGQLDFQYNRYFQPLHWGSMTLTTYPNLPLRNFTLPATSCFWPPMNSRYIYMYLP